MNTLLIIIIVLIYIAIGVAISAITNEDVLSAIVLFWIVILVWELCREIVNLAVGFIEKMGGK